MPIPQEKAKIQGNYHTNFIKKRLVRAGGLPYPAGTASAEREGLRSTFV
jgi:hypothetical protein